MQHELDIRYRTVENFVSQSSAAGVSPEMQSYLCGFGTVLICGYIERGIEIIILDRLASRAHPRVLSFIKSHFKRGTNFDCAAIEQLLSRFGPEWYRGFQSFVEQNSDVKEGVASCYGVRNSVAHGGAMTVGGGRLRELLQMSKKLIDGVVAVTR